MLWGHSIIVLLFSPFAPLPPISHTSGVNCFVEDLAFRPECLLTCVASTGDDSAAMGSLHNYFQVWQQFGFTPEFYNIPHGEPSDGREGYPLRPELVESLVYLYRSTRNPTLLRMGEHLLHSIQHSARTRCGYATVRNARACL